MATRKEIAQNQKILYDDAVANKMFQAAVPTFKEFQRRLEGPGYQKMVYDNYKKHNVKGKGFNNLNEFRGAFGGSFYADENKISLSNKAQDVSDRAGQIVNNAGRYNRLKQRKQKQQKDFGRVNLGTHLTPFGGDANNVVKDEFAYNPETGKAGAYVTSDNENAYTQSDAEQRQAILDKYGEEWNEAVDMGMVPSELDKADPDMSDTDVAMRQMERRQEWLDENQNRRSKELNESMHLQDSPFVASGGAVAPSSFNAAIGNEANRLSDAEYGAYNTAKAYNQMLRTTLLQELKEQKQRNEDAGWWKDKWNDVSNYFGAMFNTMLDPKLYSQGVMDAAIASNLRQVKKGMEEGTIKKGSNAGNAAQVMLSAIQQQQGEAAKQQQYGTKAYQYGDVSGRSLKFMADFALSGWRNVMTTGFTKAGEKVGEKMALGALGKWFTKNTGRVLGDMAGSAALAATNQLGSTYNNVIERYVGMNNENGGVTQDKNGDLKFNEGVRLGKAIKDGLGSATIENFSEMFGEYLPGASKLLSKLGLSKVSSFFEKIGNNAYYKWLSNATNKSGIQGVMAEISEEEFGTALHAAWGDGDGNWSDFNVFTNPDAREKQIDTCLGMFYSVGFMQSPRTAVGAINAVKYFNIKHQVTKADKFGQMMFGDNWDEIKNKIDVTTNADLTKTVLDATRSDSMNAKQKGAVINYAMFLSKLRGFNQASDAKTKDKVEEGDTAPTLSNDLDDAYTEGHNADDIDTHEIQLDQEDKQKSLAQLLGISEQQLASMSDEELEALSGRDDNIDRAIYDYQLSSARYQGVVDDAQDKVDLAAHQAEQRVNMYTDKSRGSVRNATIKASGGAEDYGVYIISGNIATHDDGSIDVSNSDDMILYFDPTTNSVEHADALMFAELGEELPAEEVKAKAVADAKENAIKEVAGIIDGTVDVGSQFSVTDADGTEHTYEVLADNGDGTAMITIDGNIPTELVNGESVNIPVSFADLQKMKDLEDQKRLEAAKAEREQMEKEREGKQTQDTEDSQPSFDFNQILNDNGNVVLVDVLGKDGNTKYPGSKLFLIRDAGAKAKVVELKSDGTLVSHAVNKEDVRATQPMSLDEYKQAFASSSMIEDNSGENRGEIEEEAPTIEGGTTAPSDETATSEYGKDSSTEQTRNAEQTPDTPVITLEDGTIVPMLDDGNPDFSKLTAAQTAELYDTQFDEDADGIVSGYVSDAKKALDKANSMTVKGKTFVEQKASKDAKEKAIADAQAAYDSAIAIRDAYNERQLAKEENTPEGRKGLIEKARRKFARLKNSEEWSERTGDLWNETVGKLLHRLYDATGIDVFDDTPNTVYEYVAANVGPYSLNYEGNDNSKGVQQETGLSRSDFAKLGWLAAEGKGMTIDEKVHRLWENRPSNLESADTQDIRNALISLITSGQTAFQARDYILNQRIELAESAMEEQLRQEEDAAEAQKAKEDEEKKNAELEKKTEEESKKAEEEKVEEENTEDNENTEFSDNSKEESKTVEVPEDATDDAPLGEQLDESDLPFSAKENGKQQTTAERASDVEKNKVDDMKVVDNIVGKKTRKTLEKLAKMMGANVQWQYSDKNANGWFDDKTNTIYLTLDSSITEGVQFIFGHEMTHEIKTKNPVAYEELKTIVKDMMGEDKFNSETDRITSLYNENNVFYNGGRAAYEEEVVADQLGKWIRDANYAHTLLLKMSHPLLARLHEIVNRFLMALRGIEISDDMNLILRTIEQAYVKTANGQMTNSDTGEDVSFSLRQKPEPKKKGIGYKVFVLKDGKLYPPMVANPGGAATPVGVWLDADAAPIAGESKTGRPQVKQGGKGTQGGSGKLAYRPGWHLGVVPYAIQFNRKDAEGNKTLFPKNFVFAEVEYAADVDYQEEARQEGINPSGKYQHSLAGLKHLPTDGYYMYRTNPNPETDPWVITGAMKVNRILTRAEQAKLVKNAGREPQQIQEGDIVTDDVVNSINQEIADAPKFSLKVYHGSGADFTEFDFDHMGEGAGSQVFGWGGYVTSSKKIGKSYANLVDANAPHQDVEYVGNNAHEYTDVVAGLFNGGQRDYDDVKEFLQNGYNSDKDNARKKQMLEWFESTKPSDWKSVNDGKRNLYEVDIPEDNGSNYLDWENPMSEEQINAIRDALAKNGVDVPSWEKRGFKLDLPFKNVYTAVLPMMMRCEPKEVSKFLSSLGFTGIKYPAGTIQGGAEEGDTNYVIFNPKDMKITEHTKFSIKTYHGSQASFDKFDHSFMGSGEGAQAYGWGTYVGEVEGIAKAYAKQNAAKHGMPREYKIAQTRLNHAKFEYDKVQRRYDNSKAYIDSLKEDLQNYRESIDRRKEKVAYFAQNNMPEAVDKLLKQIKRTEDTIKVTENDINMRTNYLEGWKQKLEEVKKKYDEEQKKFDAIPKPQIERNLYSVDIPDDTGENYIGWDEKMTHRMRDIRKEILEDNGYKLVDSDGTRDYFEDRDGKEYELFKEQYKTGGTFYEELAQLLHSQKLASLALKEYGFDGVKVIANRNTGGNKEGKMNYVIFDENNAQITNHTKFSLRLKSAIEETETNPSDAQKESGNYKKGHIKFGGYDYTIGNPKGSIRSGKDSDGKEWKVTMHDTYGYIRGKFGKDGDHLDMFINDKADLDNWNGDVFVVDQVNPDGSFDEHKVMYGYDSMDDAEKAYLANYSKGWKGLGNITGASKDEFDKWLDTSNRKIKPFADYEKVKFSQEQSVDNEEPKTFEEFLNHPSLKFSIKNGEQRKAAENAYEYASKLRPNKYAKYAIVDMGMPSKIPEYYEKKVLADNWRRFYNMAVRWGNYKLFDLDRPFADQVNEVNGKVPNDFGAPDTETNKGNIKGLDIQVSSAAEPHYSLKDEKTLAGVHNITEEKLRKALKLGGLANPSLAVIDTNKTGHDNFGEISFIAPSALLDKRTGKTAGTWITDAYTQRYPSVERQMSEKGSKKFRDWVDSLEYPAADKAEINRQTEDALSNNNAPAWELMYLKEKGIDIKEYNSKVDYSWKEIIRDHPTAEDILSSMQNDSELNEKVTSLVKHTIVHPTWEKVSLEVRRKIYEETGNKVSPINPQVRKQTKEIFERDYAPTLLDKNGKPKAEDIKKVVEDIVKEHNDTKKYDFYLSKVKASDYVNKNGLYDDYIRWQEKKLDEFGTKNRIFRGYKPDGTRKYVPETLDNVSKAMREEADGQTNGSEYTSFGSFIAKIASRVDSTDEMRDNKDKLSSNEDKEEFYEKWSEVYYDLAKFLYNDVFYGEQRLHDIVLQADPKKYAKKEYGITLTPTFMKKLDALKNAVRTELKSAYFETKYNRPLRLNEFAAAVVPDNLGEDVRKGIEDAGLPIYNYDPNKEGDRSRAFNEAINSSDNIRFSLKEEKEKIVADAKANGTYMKAPNGEKTKLNAEQWVTVRTTNFKNWFGDWENDPDNASKVVDENGEPMVVWHGRSAEFNTFEKKEGVRFIMGIEDRVKSEGFFFSPDKGLAEEFASNSYRHRGGKPNVVPCFLNIRRPMDLTGEDYDRIYEDVTGWEYMVGMDTQDNLWGIMDEEGMAEKIKEKGYDGAIFVEEVDDSYEPTKISYCALDANQIKSAENNNGDFSADNNDIRFSLRYDKFEHELNQWKKDNNLPKDAKRPTIPQRNVGESAVDFLRRVDEYRKQMALWKTAPTYEQHLLSDDTALGEFNRELQCGSVLKRIAFQDSMLAIRKAQEAIMKEVGVDRLNMAEDAYTAENRSHGKGKNEFEEYNNEFLQPLRKAYHQMKKVLGDSYDNVRLYMMAKHGLERNAQMAFKKSLEADYEDVAQRSAAYKAYKGDINRMGNDSGFELGLIDYATWVRTDNAIKMKYSPSYMKHRYDKMGITFDYSGLSALFDGSDFEEAAHKLVRDIESKHIVETKELWDATNAATKKILRDGYKAGMMSKDTYQYVRDMYSHYIPLRGWDGTTADQVWDYVGGGKGAFNQTLKKAHGRTSIADDPIAYIENMAESGILLNNKNWVKQHLMLLAQNHPTSLLTLSKAWYVKSKDANGNEEWIPATPQITSQMNSNQVKAAIDAFEQKMEQMEQTGDATQKREGLNIAYPQTHSEEREHEVRVMKDGEEYVIYVNGDPQLAQAMNNTRAHRVREIQSGKLDRAAAWLGRKMAAAYTSLSPLFIPSNYFRDLTMTLASTAIREDAKYNYLLRKNLATSWNLGFMLRDFQNGKLREKVRNGNATQKEQMFYDFMMNGGETGFVSSLEVEDLKKKFKNDLKDLDRWKANPVKVGHIIMDIIEFLNRMIEDSNRFAIYMTSIQYGRSIDEAVNDAKDVTLNFNRKGTGEYGWQMIRNLYLFINPAVQSLQTLGALGKHHPFKFTAVTASWIASGVLVPIVNAALMQIAAAFGGGDGDDKKWYKDISKKYWQFTKWDRRNNLIMWFPFTHEFIKIPLAQEFRAFYGVGDMIASNMMGGKLAKESWSQYAEDLLGQVVDMLPLDPTGYDGNIAVSLMPNAVRPVFELAFNIDFTGKPLFNETEYNKYDPNFTKAYVGTPDWLVRASRMMNSIGNDYPDVQQNKWDAFGNPRFSINNPAVVDHVLSSYLGGAYTMGSQVLGLLTKSLNDPKEIKVADIPLFSKFVSNPDDRPVTKKQGDEFWNMKENHDRAANTLSKLKKQAKVDGDYSMLERFYGSEEYKQYKQDDVKVKKYEEDKKKERAEESGEEYRPHKLNAEDIYKAHATPKDDFEDLKLEQLYTKLNGFKSTYDLLFVAAPSQSDGYYNDNKDAIDAINDISFDKQKISELKKGLLDDGKDAYNAEDMKRIRELRKKVLAVLEKANKVVVANQKAKKK